MHSYFVHYDDLIQIEFIKSKNENHLNERETQFQLWKPLRLD